jgi:hypothetical protein
VTGPVVLAPESVELIARRVAELLEGSAAGSAPELIDAAEVARRFGVKPAWVREHANELGAVPLGSGSRPRLRFHADRVAEALSLCLASRGSGQSGSPAPERKPRRRASSSLGTSPDLLPIRGQKRPR